MLYITYYRQMTFFRENQTLLNAFREGHPDVLRKVYFFYVDDIVMLLKSGFIENRSGTFVRGIHDPERQRELLQDIFLKAFSLRARLSYDGLRPYKSYLNTIAGNVMIDAWRFNNRDPLASQRREPEEVVLERELQRRKDAETAHENTEEQLHWHRCLEASDAFVATLDTLSREFVKYRFQKGLPQRQVGRKLNLTHSKVRTLEKRIQNNLKKHLRRLNLIDW